MGPSTGQPAVGDQLPLVHYSVVFQDDLRAPQLLRQLAISLTTLRSTNPKIPVVVYCHGAPPLKLSRICARVDAEIIERPPLAEGLDAVFGRLGPALAGYAPLQKWMNFDDLAARAGAHRHVVYLDADTVVFSPIGGLAPAEQPGVPTIRGREEVSSERCPHGADPTYLDERALAASVPFTPAPAFNTGIVSFEDLDWAESLRLQRRWVSWVVRLALWMAQRPTGPAADPFGDVVDVAAVDRLTRSSVGRRLASAALPYPSRNRWLLEEVAFWLAVGQDEAVTFRDLDPAVAAQGAEPNVGRLPRVVWHYFSRNQEGMERRLGLNTRRIDDRRVSLRGT